MPRFYVHVKHGTDLIRDEEGVDLPRDEKLARFRRSASDPMDVIRTESDMGRHGGQEYVLVRSQARPL